MIDKEKPFITESTDAIIRMVKTTICGTYLHIIKGDTPEVPSNTTLGHVGIGIVESVGSSVNNFKVGDKVIISCISSCGKCYYCKKVFMHIVKKMAVGYQVTSSMVHKQNMLKYLSQTTLYTIHQNLYQTKHSLCSLTFYQRVMKLVF